MLPHQYESKRDDSGFGGGGGGSSSEGDMGNTVRQKW